MSKAIPEVDDLFRLEPKLSPCLSPLFLSANALLLSLGRIEAEADKARGKRRDALRVEEGDHRLEILAVGRLDGEPEKPAHQHPSESRTMRQSPGRAGEGRNDAWEPQSMRSSIWRWEVGETATG